jgi:N-methylhydantoinase A
MTGGAPGGGGAARLAVDIGGTFTDIVLEHGARRVSAKVLTDHAAPERGVMAGLRRAIAMAGIAPEAVALVVHGTTLATNAIIERKGACTALITSEGFRDVIEMGHEHRFEQYDLYIEKPAPLVPRPLRLSVPERVDAKGAVRVPLDEAALAALLPVLRAAGVEAVAVGFLHSYRNPEPERRAGAILAAGLPGAAVTLSSDVCPEMREYERFSTACANAYVQPLMARYLRGLAGALRADGFACPLLLMTSGGGLTTLEIATRLPIRLVESGPAGGAILAAGIARDLGLARILSFDMGGTTAKICLIDDGQPMASRSFEVDRRYMFLKGSGLPLRVPVIEMVEIGAGGGSIAAVDAMGRVTVGPASAGSEPGPACYGRGGEAPTVTDANLVLGRIDPARFAAGTIALDTARATAAVDAGVGVPQGLEPALAAFAVSEIVEENMANAARVHAVERGAALQGRTLVACGGSAPLHAARLARKLGMTEVLIPPGAGVGSALGFLRAPIGFEVVRSRVMPLDRLDHAATRALLAEMAEEATAVVRQGAPAADIALHWGLEMRYAGQGHEIGVALPSGIASVEPGTLHRLFEARYQALFGRVVPGMAIEITAWTVRAEAPAPAVIAPEASAVVAAAPATQRALFDPETGAMAMVPVHARAALPAGTRIAGPALIVEDETTTMVIAGFLAEIAPGGAILLRDTRGHEVEPA